MKTNKIIMAALGVALVGAIVNANAGTVVTSTTALLPSLTITGACSVDLTNTPFPSAPSNTAAGSTISGIISTITVSGCDNVNYRLGADGGSNFGTVGAARNLSNGTPANDIAYTLDLGGDASQTDWGSAGMPTAMANQTGTSIAYKGTGATDTFTVTGDATVPAGMVAGTFTDTVAVAIEF